MRKQVVKALTKVGLLSLIGMVMAVGSAEGQSLAYKIKAHIPFDFIVADKKLPAGDYSIGRAQQNSGDSVLLISSIDSAANVFSLTSASEALAPTDEGRLVFHRYGDQYFLFQVWPAGASTGRVIAKSRGERDLQRTAREAVASKATRVETVPLVVGLQ